MSQRVIADASQPAGCTGGGVGSGPGDGLGLGDGEGLGLGDGLGPGEEHGPHKPAMLHGHDELPEHLPQDASVAPCACPAAVAHSEPLLPDPLYFLTINMTTIAMASSSTRVKVLLAPLSFEGLALCCMWLCHYNAHYMRCNTPLQFKCSRQMLHRGKGYTCPLKCMDMFGHISRHTNRAQHCGPFVRTGIHGGTFVDAQESTLAR